MNKYSKFIYTLLMINNRELFMMTDCINKISVQTNKGGRIEIYKNYPFDARITGDLSDITFHL